MPALTSTVSRKSISSSKEGLLCGVGLPTPPQAPPAGLPCGVWHGQETGHSVMTAHEFMRHGTSES